MKLPGSGRAAGNAPPRPRRLAWATSRLAGEERRLRGFQGGGRPEAGSGAAAPEEPPYPPKRKSGPASLARIVSVGTYQEAPSASST
jgi:hypothetical protein